MEGRGVLFWRAGVLVVDGSIVHQASRSSSGTQRMGVFLATVLSAVGPLEWIGLWSLHGSRLTMSLPQKQVSGRRSGRAPYILIVEPKVENTTVPS